MSRSLDDGLLTGECCQQAGKPRDENQSKILYTNGLGEEFQPIQRFAGMAYVGLCDRFASPACFCSRSRCSGRVWIQCSRPALQQVGTGVQQAQPWDPDEV